MFRRLVPLLAALLLTACAPGVVYVTAPPIGPAELQRLSDSATNTAAAVMAQATQDARQAAGATATDQSARETAQAASQATQAALAAQQTESALSLTQAAAIGLATDAAAGRTQAAGQTQAWATTTAAALSTQAAAASVDRSQQQANAVSWAEFWRTVQTVLVALLIVAGLAWIAVTVIDRVSRIVSQIHFASMRERAAIGRESFRLLPPGHWAEWGPDQGYQVYALPAPLDEPPAVLENAAPNPSRLHKYRHAIRLAGFWADGHGFGVRDLGPAGIGVMSDGDWRVIFGGSGVLRAVGAVVERTTPGEKGKKTGWADDWSFTRLSDDLSHGRLDRYLPAEGDPPNVAFTVPTTPPQHTTAPQPTQLPQVVIDQ